MLPYVVCKKAHKIGYPNLKLFSLQTELENLAKAKSREKSPYLLDLCFATQDFLGRIKNSNGYNTINHVPNSQIQKQLENAQRNEKLSYFDAHPETELSRISLPYVEVEVTSEQFKGKY